MVLPFLLMVSGSVKGKVDAYDFDLVPAFLTDRTVLYRKYVEEKYNERFQEYRLASRDSVVNFRSIQLPEPFSQQLIEDWETFTSKEKDVNFFHLGAMSATETAGQIMIPNNLRGFRNYIKDLCGGDLNIFREKYASKLGSWFYLKLEAERFLDRNYAIPADNAVIKSFLEYKKSSSIYDRIYLSVDAAYAKKCKANEIYQGSIALFNSINSTHYGSFDEIILSDRVPSTTEKDQWESFVRKTLHPQFIRILSSGQTAYTQFLLGRHKSLKRLNKLYQTSYLAFEEVPIPDDRATASPELIDFLLFVENVNALAADQLVIDTPELRWRSFLRSQYVTVNEAAVIHGKEYASFIHIPIPQKEIDSHYCNHHVMELKWHFLNRNYQMVFEFISVYGNGIKNSVVYCFLAVLIALIINPIAAYALSRYKLPTQYKILLYFITTVAFPSMVTMIPSYLLLKDLGLLNTFSALILPGAASGYSIFLLKGFFDSLPQELYEASDIDGASEWFKFWNITIRLSKPILAVIALGAFTVSYSNFMYAFVLCQDSEMWTLMVWLYQLQYYSAQGVRFASLLVSAVPTLIVFILAQRIIIRGIVVPQEK